jgi:hypothetical protein
MGFMLSCWEISLEANVIIALITSGAMLACSSMLLLLARTTLVAIGCLVRAGILVCSIIWQDGFAAALTIQKLLLHLPELPLYEFS